VEKIHAINGATLILGVAVGTNMFGYAVAPSENKLENMIKAINQDRERFFKKADVYAITNNRGLSPEQIVELGALRDQWRDSTDLPDYPDIDFPLPLPEWFPNPYFASSWKKGYLNEDKF